jgi:hypothetical protein
MIFSPHVSNDDLCVSGSESTVAEERQQRDPHCTSYTRTNLRSGIKPLPLAGFEHLPIVPMIP